MKTKLEKIKQEYKSNKYKLMIYYKQKINRNEEINSIKRK